MLMIANVNVLCMHCANAVRNIYTQKTAFYTIHSLTPQIKTFCAT